MKYTVKKDAFSSQWYVVTENSALTYKTATWFRTKEEADMYIEEEKAYAAERMANIPTISDYFKVGA